MNCERCLKRGFVRSTHEGYRYCVNCARVVLRELQECGYLTQVPHECKRHYETPTSKLSRHIDNLKDPPLWWDNVPRAYEEALELDRPD
jgi:hypothetical protein